MVGVRERSAQFPGDAPPSLPPEAGGPDDGSRAPGRRSAATTIALWFFRALLITPFVMMGPEIIAGIRGETGAVANLSESTAGVLGTSTMVIFMMMLTVTPIATMTGWTWHIPLRRDYGVGMFVVAVLDLTLAATTTGDTFSGGVPGRLGGRSFLFVGTLAVLLLVPLAITANHRAQRWLGSYWKRLHRLVYVIWGLILLHLLLLFGFKDMFVHALVISVPLAILRVPAVRRWWVTTRRARQHRLLRGALALLLVGTFTLGYVPVIKDLISDGTAAFNQQPEDD